MARVAPAVGVAFIHANSQSNYFRIVIDCENSEERHFRLWKGQCPRKPTFQARDASTSRHAGQCFLAAGLAMGKLVAADHDGDQARDLRYGTGKERLQGGETA